MVTRSASASYEGLGKDGKGKITTQSGVLSDTQYGFNTRFEDGAGTTIAAQPIASIRFRMVTLPFFENRVASTSSC